MRHRLMVNVAIARCDHRHASHLCQAYRAQPHDTWRAEPDPPMRIARVNRGGGGVVGWCKAGTFPAGIGTWSRRPGLLAGDRCGWAGWDGWHSANWEPPRSGWVERG